MICVLNANKMKATEHLIYDWQKTVVCVHGLASSCRFCSSSFPSHFVFPIQGRTPTAAGGCSCGFQKRWWERGEAERCCSVAGAVEWWRRNELVEEMSVLGAPPEGKRWWWRALAA